MATHKIGKLKFNLSKQGLAYKWGEGDVRRFNFGKKAPSTENEYDNYEAYPEDGYEDAGFDEADEQSYADYDEDYEAQPGDYDDGYADGEYAGGEYDSGYDGDDYAEGDYDQPYAESAYDDQPYDEADYDDGAYDEGYDEDYAEGDYDQPYDEGDYDDQPYDDDGYDQPYDGEYDDPYSETDANEAYQDDYYGEGENSLLQYVDENNWVIYVLLILLPPLGIYLLWRSNRFEKIMRYGLSAASGVWMVIALILIFTGIFGGNGDVTRDKDLPLPSVAPSASATVVPTATVSASASATVAPSATPIGGTSGTGTGTSGDSTGSTEYVYSPASGLYYHSSNTCANIGAGVSTSRIPVEIAQSSRNQSACPLCYTGSSNGGTGSSQAETYYATRGGTYYHLDKTCSGMKSPSTYTKEAAEKAGKVACPVCVTKIQKTLDTSAVKIITSSTVDKSNITVYATKGGKHYHMTSDCSGMQGASKGSLKAALLAGKTACSTCCKAAGTTVYCTAGGKYYHLKSTCSGMKNALNVTLAEALVLGKQRCTDCVKTSLTSGTSSGSTTDSDTVYVYGTKNGKYYHTTSNCSGMKDAQKYTLKSMILANREACPECAASANTLVYAKKGGTYYHSYATCSGMEHATSGTMAEALAYGFKRCPKCWSSSTGSSTTTSAGVNTGSATKVYATQTGTYYHTVSDCSGMKNASQITLATAVNNGKTACPTCASAAKRMVYSTDGGTYYHTVSDCSDMKNAEKRTLQAALLLNQKACPECIGKSSTNSSGTTSSGSSSTFKSGTSGIKVYATQAGEFYHTDKDCSGMKNASHITLETALNYGKKACTTCAASAARTVYATKSGKYYHASKSCAGSGAKSGTLGEAVAYGYDPCPYCVSKTSTSGTAVTTTYKSGTSGVKVYATISGKYFHRESDCSGMKNASLVTLETAMNYGKTGCPECFASANKTVYAKGSSKYYHYDKSCAGSGALAGTLAKARALGMSPCTKCTTSSSSTSSSSGNIDSTGKDYSATASTSVYIDLDGGNYYYHKSKNCSTTGTKNATKVTLQYVKDLGYKACPYCEPPTSISNA